MNCENIDTFISNALVVFQQNSSILSNVALENMTIPRMADTIRGEMLKKGITVVVPEIAKADPITQVSLISKLIQNINNASPFVDLPLLKFFAEYLSNGTVYAMYGHAPVLETVSNLKYFAGVSDEQAFRISKSENTPPASWSYMFLITGEGVEIVYRQVTIMRIERPTGYVGGRKNAVCIIFSRTEGTTNLLNIMISVNGLTIVDGSHIQENTPTSILNTTFHGVTFGFPNSPYRGAFVGVKIDSPQFEYKKATAKFITAYADYLFSNPT